MGEAEEERRSMGRRKRRGERKWGDKACSGPGRDPPVLMVTGTGPGQAHTWPQCSPWRGRAEPGARGRKTSGLSLTFTITSSHLDFRNYSK